MNRRRFIQALAAIPGLLTYELHAKDPIPSAIIDIRELNVTFPFWLISTTHKRSLQKVILTKIDPAEPRHSLFFQKNVIVQLDSNVTPQKLLNLNNGYTSREYMLLKRVISYVLYHLLSDVDKFQNEEVVDHISLAQLSSLLIRYKKHPIVTWDNVQGFSVRQYAKPK